MSAEITVDVGVKLQVIQSSLDNFKKILSNLEPNSSGYKNLSKIIAEMTKEMERFQVQTSKGFSSSKQFDQASRTLDKMEESITRAGLAVDRIKFSDIKLTPDQQSQFKKLEEELEQIEQKFAVVQERTKQGIFNNDAIRSSLDVLDSKAIEKDLDTILTIATSKGKQAREWLANIKQDIEELNKTSISSESQKKLNDLMTNGLTTENAGKAVYSYQGKGIRFRSGALKEQFIKSLEEEFHLEPSVVEKLKEMSANQISQAFQQLGRRDTNNIFQGIIDKINADKEKLASLTDDETKYQGMADAAKNVSSAIQDATKEGTAYARALEEHDTGLRRVVDSEERAQAAIRGSAQAAGGGTSALAQMNSQLQSFRTSLEQADAAFLRLQAQQQTFNSIKTAIVNFMGFNQVLNLTKTAVKNAMNHIKELDSVMNGISIVTDMSTADLWKQVDAYSAIAQNYGVTIQGAYEVSKIYYQQGR